jgi:squalene-hopene/tetraprenyl-beta-curcumene cyclase
MSRPLTPLIAVLLAVPLAAHAQPAQPDAAAAGQRVVDRALAYLLTQQQANGSFQKADREPPAVTALVLKGLVQSPAHGPQSPAAKKAVEYLASVQRDNGGIYKDMLANYNTAIAVSALAATRDPAHTERIAKAVAYLKGAQWTDAIAGPNGEKITPDHPQYGGWNYGGARGGTADVSNTAIVLEALKDSGLKPDDAAYQNAVKFINRLQNHSETNRAPWAGDDGGFIYNPGRTGEGSSAAGEYASADGRRLLRSYGSMTYAGLKSMVYAGLTKDDPRVKAAWDWVRSNWTLDEHPGMAANGPQHARDGLFYYYQTLARALSVYGEPTVVDKKNARHDWRAELIAKLASLQKEDGSFTGTAKWMEDNATISTAFAVLAAQDALADLKERPAK